MQTSNPVAIEAVVKTRSTRARRAQLQQVKPLFAAPVDGVKNEPGMGPSSRPERSPVEVRRGQHIVSGS